MTCPRCQSHLLPEAPLRYSAMIGGDISDDAAAFCLMCGYHADKTILQNQARQRFELALVAEAAEIAREAMTKPLVWDGQ